MDRESILSLAEAYQQVVEQGPTDGANSDRVKYPAANKFKDADRPPGWYTVNVGGKDVARYWPGGKNYGGGNPDKGTGWKVNGPNPNAPIGMGQASDDRAQEIRQGEWDARNQGIVQGGVDAAGNIAAGSIAAPMTTWSGITTGGQNMWNSFQNALKGQGDIKAPSGSTVTPGARYPAQQGGKWGYIIYDKDGKGKWQEDARATPFQDRLQGVKDFVTGTDRSIPVVPGLTGPDGIIPGTDNTGGGGGGGGGGGSEEEGEKPEEEKPPGSDVTQTGPNSAGLTPMQQWAKKFPHLAAKVKPGQAGYDDIQKMNSPQAQARAAVTQTDVGDMNNAKNNVQQAFGNNQKLDQVSQPIQRAASQQKDFSDRMNRVNADSMSRYGNQQPQITRSPGGGSRIRQPQTQQNSQATGKHIKPMSNTPRLDKALTGIKRLPGLPEEFDLDAVLDAMADGLNEGRGLGAGKSDAEKSAARNANAGHSPENSFASAQRQMRSASQRGKKKERGVKVPKPQHLTPAQELQHRTGMTKARLAQKHSGTAAGRRQIANNALDAAELGGTKNNRGS